MQINTKSRGDKLYRVCVGSGIVWTYEFHVYARHKNDALDRVADYCEDNELIGAYAYHYDLVDFCDENQSVDEYAAAHNLVLCGNSSIYLDVTHMEECK